MHLKVGLPPVLRINGKLVPLWSCPGWARTRCVSMAAGVMNAEAAGTVQGAQRARLAYGVPGLGRFRVNVFQQRGTMGIVLRLVPSKIQTFAT